MKSQLIFCNKTHITEHDKILIHVNKPAEKNHCTAECKILVQQSFSSKKRIIDRIKSDFHLMTHFKSYMVKWNSTANISTPE